MPYSLLRKVFCPIIFWQTTEHRVWGFLPSPGEASAAKAKSRKSKDAKKASVPEKALGRPAQQHRTLVSHMVPHSSKTGKLTWGQWRERERENGCHCIYVREWLMLTPVPYRIEISATSISWTSFSSFGPAARRKASKRAALKPRTGVTCCWRSMKNWRRGQLVWGIYWPLWSRVELGNHPCCDLIQAFDFSRSSFALLCCWVAEVLMWQTQISNLG